MSAPIHGILVCTQADSVKHLPAWHLIVQFAPRIVPDARVVYVDNDCCKSGCAHARTQPAKILRLLSRCRTTVGLWLGRPVVNARIADLAAVLGGAFQP
jgi:S-adenosyl methyltransferase